VRLAAFVLAMVVPLVADAEKRKKPRAKRLYVRGVVAHVEPRITTQNVQLDPSGLAANAIGDDPLDDSGVTVSASAKRPTAIVGYVLPGLRNRLSIEAMVGAPVPLKIGATGKLATESLAPDAAGTPTGIPPLGANLAEATISPPMITALYRPWRHGRISVLAGGGASVLLVYDERVTNPVLTEVSEPHLEITHAFGVVAQGGVEARLWRRVVARLDVKYIWYRMSHATIDNIQVKTQIPLLPTVEVGDARMDISVQPIIVQLGIGADF
jgi:outer membrane protein W